MKTPHSATTEGDDSPLTANLFAHGHGGFIQPECDRGANCFCAKGATTQKQTHNDTRCTECRSAMYMHTHKQTHIQTIE